VLRGRSRPHANLLAFYTWSKTRDDDSNERDHLNVYYQDWQHLDREFGPSKRRAPYLSQRLVAPALEPQLGWTLPPAAARPTATSRGGFNNDHSYGNDREPRDGRDSGRNARRRLPPARPAPEQIHGARRTALEVALDVFTATDADNL
jgi:hypothetical protein